MRAASPFLHRQHPTQLVEEIEEQHDLVVHDVGLRFFGEKRQPLAVGVKVVGRSDSDGDVSGGRPHLRFVGLE